MTQYRIHTYEEPGGPVNMHRRKHAQETTKNMTPNQKMSCVHRVVTAITPKVVYNEFTPFEPFQKRLHSNQNGYDYSTNQNAAASRARAKHQ